MISRKEKSLGLLCHKFLARYPDYPNPVLNIDICLDDVASELSTSASWFPSPTLFVASSFITSRRWLLSVSFGTFLIYLFHDFTLFLHRCGAQAYL